MRILKISFMGKEIEVIKHENFDDCYGAWINDKDETHFVKVYYSGDTEPCRITIRQDKKQRKENGCFGFYYSEKNQMHLWCDETKLKIEEIIEVIGHELGHIVDPIYNDKIKEEIKADKYSEVARAAYQIYKRIIL